MIAIIIEKGPKCQEIEEECEFVSLLWGRFQKER